MARRLQNASVTRPMSTSQPAKSTQWQQPSTTSEAQRLEHDEFAAAIKRFIMQADQNGTFNDQKFHEDQRAASVRVNDGAISMHASGGDSLSAAGMKRIFHLAVEAHGTTFSDPRPAA